MESMNRLEKYLDGCEFVPPPSECPKRTWIGGSTFHKCVANPESFLRSQKNIFHGNTATRWGNVFEEATIHILEKNYDIKIETPRSIVGVKDEEGNVVLSYTPDGLSMFKPELSKKLLDVDQEQMILFEFKSPYNRIPNGVWDAKTRGYLSQIKTGLSVIPADRALYYDCVYRICSIEDYGFTDEQIIKHRQTYVHGKPFDIGFIFFFKEKEYPFYDVEEENLSLSVEEQIVNLHTTFTPKVTDRKWRKMLACKLDSIEWFGYSVPDVSGDEFESVLAKRYENVYVTSHRIIKENFVEMWKYARENNLTPVGFVAWKLMAFKKLKVEREEGFVQKHISTLNYVSTKMRENQSDDEDF